MGELDLKQFDIERFDFDQVFSEVRQEIQKPNILICGGTGVGKSSLVNDIFHLSGEDMAKVGLEWSPETMGVQKFTSDSSTVNLYDSQGYEIGMENDEIYLHDIVGFIDAKRKEDPLNIAEHIHEVWYCISAGNKRFFDMDRKLIEEIRNLHVPIMILLTKIDEVSADELQALKSTVQEVFPELAVYTYSTFIRDEAIRRTYVQKEAITSWAVAHIDESLLGGLLPALSGAIDEKAKYIRTTIVPKYTGLAVGTVTATSFLPVSFVDSVPLMTIQVKMAMNIFQILGINYDIKSTLGSIAGSTLASYIGRTLSTKLLGMIPYINKVTKFVEAGVNMTVAGTITATLGMAILTVCVNYMKTCLDPDGKSKVTFAEFFTTEALQSAIDYVGDHMREFDIETIVNKATAKKQA